MIQGCFSCQPHGPVIHNTTLVLFAQNRGDSLASHKEEGADQDDRGKDFDGKKKAVSQIVRHFFRSIQTETKQGAQNHQERGCTGDQAGGIAALQPEDKHQQDVSQKGQRGEYGNEKSGFAGNGIRLGFLGNRCLRNGIRVSLFHTLQSYHGISHRFPIEQKG